jgi:quinol-cytochrome oxidoreductase complex cytochrome b subunit
MSSEHSIEYHKTWAVFFTIVVVGLVVMALYGMAIGHDTYLHRMDYENKQKLACISSDRPPADCRLIMYGSN